MAKLDPRKALGKGIHSLLPARSTSHSTTTTEVAISGAQIIPIEQVAPNPDQPRRVFHQDALLELQQSIETDGVIQPILVRQTGPRKYEIIAGERRWRAATAAGLKNVPVIVREATDQQVLELALIENIQREDLNPMELAIGFHRMSQLGLSHDEIGRKTGKQRTTVTNALRLLQLAKAVGTMVAANVLSAGHARALLKFSDPVLQESIARRAIDEEWSVRQIEDFTRPGGVEGKHSRKAKAANDTPTQDANVKFAIDELERVLGTRVRITAKGPNKGQIEIEYYSDDDLNRVYEAIVGAP